jgi:hypothetical protein
VSVVPRALCVSESSCRNADPEPATHHLGLLFIVLALSKLLYGEENYTVDSQDYFVLSRVALTFDSPVTTTTVTAVQTIVRGFLETGCGALSHAGLHGGVPGAERCPYGPDRLRQGVDVHRDSHETRTQCESRALVVFFTL